MSLFDDLRHSGRALRRSPAFTLAASLTLVLGMGAALVVLRLIDATLLRPLPGVAEPERLVAMTSSSVSYPSFLDFREAGAPVAEIAGFQNRPLVVGLPEGSERVQGAVVSGGFFRVLGVRATAGRLFVEDDDRVGAPPIAVLGARFAERLGGAGAVGRTVRINDVPFEIVGIADPAFRGVQLAQAPQVWVPMQSWAAARPSSFAGRELGKRGWSWINLFGRLRPGVTQAAAQAALQTSAARQEHDYPNETRTGFAVELRPARNVVAGIDGLPAARGFSAMLAVAALVILLLACANVANLLLARGEARRRELATRLALGASRREIASTVLAEAFWIALGAALGGLALVALAARLLAAVRLPGGVLLGSFDLLPDPRLALLGFGLAVVATLILGGLPARRAARDGLTAAMRGAGGGSATGRLAGALVATQVALAVVLLAGAGLLGRALGHALALDTGLSTEKVAMATVDMGLARYDAARAGRSLEEALAAAQALPGVEHAAWVTNVPLTPDYDTESITVPGYTPAPDEHPEVEIAMVGRDYAATLGVPLRAGRAFGPQDRDGAEPVALANEAFVRRYLSGRDPLGVSIGLVGHQVKLVGVLADTRQHDLLSTAEPCLMVALEPALREMALQPLTLLVRTDGDPAGALPGIERALRGAAPGAPVFQVGTFDDVYSALLAPQRFGAALLGLFGGLGLVLSALGVFSVVSYAASRRTREVGIRAALGATARDVVRLFVGESLKRVGIGAAIGVGLAALLAPALRTLLYGISPVDPMSYAGAALALLAVAALAAFLPARRAAVADPSRALRED